MTSRIIVILLVVTMVSTVIGYKLYQDKSLDYVEGEVLVTFEPDTTYKEAKDIFKLLTITSYSNNYWKSTNKQITDDIVLTEVDVFEVIVDPGKEDILIDKLLQQSKVRAATKNYITTAN